MDSKIKTLLKSYAILKALIKTKDTPIDMPEKIEKGAQGDWKKEGYTLKIGKWNDQVPKDKQHLFDPKHHDFSVTAHDKNGKQVGYANLYHEGSRLYPAEVSVDKRHRRKGITSGMYDHAYQLSDKHVYPSTMSSDSPEISSDAEKFWEHRLKKSDPKFIKLLKIAKELVKEELLQKPYVSDAQRRWDHTDAGKEALGAETVAHYDKESKDLDLPEKIEKGAQGDWETEGYKIIYEGFDENYKNKEGVAGHVFQVAHPKHGNVGQVVFTINPHTGNLNPIPYINKEHRRKGLATEIYKRAEKELGLKVEIGSKQSPDASLLWSQPNRPFGKSESLFKCLIDLSLLEDDILTKADEQNRPPRFVGDRHPDPQKGWVGVKHPNGILMWHQPPGRAAAHDKFINDPKNKEKILNRFKSNTHRKIMAQVMDNTIKDPNRHFIPSEENGRQRLRARHLKSLINNENHIRIDESDPNILHLERDTHSQGQNKGQKSHLYYKGVVSGTPIKKSEGLHRPRTVEFMELLWRRDTSGFRPGQYELCTEQNTADSRVDAGNDNNRRSFDTERLNKSYMKRHLEDIGHFNPIPDWQKSYLSKSEDQYVYHYSPHAGLKTLDPKHMGTGAKGAFSSKFNPSKIPDFPHVLFTYMHDTPEDIVKQPAVSKYMIKLNPDHVMYDIGKDEHGLVKQAIQENQGVYNYENVFKKIKDAGFHGIVNPNHDNPVVKNTALLFYPQQVHSETSAK